MQDKCMMDVALEDLEWKSEGVASDLLNVLNRQTGLQGLC